MWRVRVCVPAEIRLAVEEMLQIRCAAVVSFEADDGFTWSVEGLTMKEPDRLAFEMALAQVLRAFDCYRIIPLLVDVLPQRDWLAENLASFPPRRVGRYLIVGSHIQAPTPSGSIKLRLDPGTAFGSGEHATTEGCLKILHKLAKFRNFRRPLDLGCGSGILALAIAKTWHRLVVASDIAPEAVCGTKINARKNKIAPLVLVVRGDGFGSQLINRTRSYDLIVANILARPLIAMAADVERHLQRACNGGGTVILSGFLESDIRWVLAAYKARGLMLQKILILDGWATLMLSR